jgi:hypothetical protein
MGKNGSLEATFALSVEKEGSSLLNEWLCLCSNSFTRAKANRRIRIYFGGLTVETKEYP